MLAYPIYATERETRVLEWLAHRVRYDYPVYYNLYKRSMVRVPLR